MNTSAAERCPKCGCDWTEGKEYHNIAFPTAPTIWRLYCPDCKWYSDECGRTVREAALWRECNLLKAQLANIETENVKLKEARIADLRSLIALASEGGHSATLKYATEAFAELEKG